MSSQSIIHKPESPTAAFDLNLFSRVLLTKQASFNQGADAVQAKINNIENQAVIGEAQKKYLADKVNGIVTGINGMGGMDFSDRNVLNQTSSYIDSVTKDPTIVNAINNTRSIQKGMSYFEKLRTDAASGKKGVYYNPANEYDYMEGVNDYLRKSKTDVNAAYADRPITPPVDVNRALMTAAKDVVASSYVDRDGRNQYILKTGKVVTPERLYESVLTQIQTDPTLANQIRINSKFNYLQKDANGNLSTQQLNNLKQTYLQSTDNKILRLQDELVQQSKLLASAGSTQDQLKIQSQIDDTAAELTRYEKNRSTRANEIDVILATNPEAAAQNVYTNKLLEGIVAARAFREENVKFDQAAMFEEKMRMEKDQQNYDRTVTERKLALEAAGLALQEKKIQGELDKDAAKAAGTTGGYISEETSLPSNLRKSSQEVLMEQIRGVDMQKANLQQDFYHYIYELKDGKNLINKDGDKYAPTKQGMNIWQDNMKMLKDQRDGKKIPVTLDPEFIKIANRYQELELVRGQYENVAIDVYKEALNAKRKEVGVSDDDYELFLKGKALVDLLPEKTISTANNSGLNMGSLSSSTAKVKDYSQLPNTEEAKKAVEIFNKYSPKIQVDKEKIEDIHRSKSGQIIPRTITPVGLKDADLEARSKVLAGQIASRGYYTVDGSRKPEDTVGEQIGVKDVKYIGDFQGDLGEGFRPYVKVEITRGSGEKKTTEQVFVDVDQSYISNFRNFAQNVNEAARQHILRENSLNYDSYSSDGRNVIQTKIVKRGRGLDSENAAVQIYVTHENGKRITPKAITIKKTENMNISQAVEYAKNFAEDYSTFYKQGLKTGADKFTKLSVSNYIEEYLNKEDKTQ